MLAVGAGSQQLWTFSASKGGFALDREYTVGSGDPLPAKQVAKDWRQLIQKRLDIALLPIEKVFLHVVHLPEGSFEETQSMVEFQLEKLSPLPVTQVVWSIEILPHRVNNLQTVIVVIVARDVVDELLGQVEAKGYRPDRLEVPMIDQLLATPITSDGAWIYPFTSTGKFTALVAWWYGGALRSLGLVHVAAAQNRGELLEEQLKQMAWAGELEGWLTSTPRWHLVADESTAHLWQPLFIAWLGNSVEVETPIAPTELAALTARRAARADFRANVLPPDYAARYRQQHIDKLWGRGLLAALAIYCFGLLIYFGLSTYQGYVTDNVVAERHRLSIIYTNTLQLKARLGILQERQALKYAFLDCWSNTAALMPDGLTLQDFQFKNGQGLTWNGLAPDGKESQITDFNERLRKSTTAENQPLFRSVDLATTKRPPGGGAIQWNFSAQLSRSEDE